MTVTATITTGISGSYVGPDELAPTAPLSYSARTAYTPGTTAGKCDRLFKDTRTVAASANDDLDLAGGVTDAFGRTLTFVKVREIMIIATATNTNNVVVGGGSNPFLGPFADATDKIVLAPGAQARITAPAAGWTVTAGTGDILRIANSAGGTTVEYVIWVFGTSA
jgi:hypothetical protein